MKLCLRTFVIILKVMTGKGAFPQYSHLVAAGIVLERLSKPHRPLLVSRAAEEDAERSAGRAWSPPVPVAAANSLGDVRGCSFFISPR